MEVPKAIDKRIVATLLVTLILCGIIWRLIPHLPNFAPIGAIALVSGTILGWRKSLLAVGSIMLLSDIVLGFYSSTAWTWLGLGLIGGVGFLIKNLPPPTRIVIGALSASLLFFAVSNFGTWVASGMYSYDLAGFIQCYVMALPFFKATLLSDMVFTGLLLTAYEAFVSYYGRRPAVTVLLGSPR